MDYTELVSIINKPGGLEAHIAKITPTEEQTNKAIEIYKEIDTLLRGASNYPSEIYDVCLFGSVAKGIHLPGNFDIDITLYINAISLSADEHSTIAQQWARTMAAVRTRIVDSEGTLTINLEDEVEPQEKGTMRSLAFLYKDYEVDIVVAPAKILPLEQHYQFFPNRHVMSGGLNCHVLDFMNNYCNDSGRKLIRFAKWMKNELFPLRGKALGNSVGVSSFFVEHVMLYVFHKWSIEKKNWDALEPKLLPDNLSEEDLREIIHFYLKKLLHILSADKSGNAEILWTHIVDYYKTPEELAPKILLELRGQPRVMNAVDPTNNLLVSGNLSNESFSMTFSCVKNILSALGQLDNDHSKLNAFKLSKAPKSFHTLENAKIYNTALQKMYFLAALGKQALKLVQPANFKNHNPLDVYIGRLYTEAVYVQAKHSDLKQVNFVTAIPKETKIYPHRRDVPVLPNASDIAFSQDWSLGLGELCNMNDYSKEREQECDVFELISINIKSRIAADCIMLGDFDTGFESYAECIRTGLYAAIHWGYQMKALSDFFKKTCIKNLELDPTNQNTAIFLAWVLYNCASRGLKVDFPSSLTSSANHTVNELRRSTIFIIKTDIDTCFLQSTQPQDVVNEWRLSFLYILTSILIDKNMLISDYMIALPDAFPAAAIKERALVYACMFVVAFQDKSFAEQEMHNSMLFNKLNHTELQHLKVFGSEIFNITHTKERFLTQILPEAHFIFGDFEIFKSLANLLRTLRNTDSI